MRPSKVYVLLLIPLVLWGHACIAQGAPDSVVSQAIENREQLAADLMFQIDQENHRITEEELQITDPNLFHQIFESKRALGLRKAKWVERLGDLGCPSSIPKLIKLLRERFEPDAYVCAHNDISECPPSPAMKALAKFGALAVIPLIDELEHARGYNVQLIKQTLAMLDCEETVSAVLAWRYRLNKSEVLKSAFRRVTGHDLAECVEPNGATKP